MMDEVINDRFSLASGIRARRRVDLLSKVMPLLAQMITRQFQSPERPRRERIFWARLQGPMGIIYVGGWRFDRLGDQNQELVEEVLEHFESILDTESVSVAWPTLIFQWQLRFYQSFTTDR